MRRQGEWPKSPNTERAGRGRPHWPYRPQTKLGAAALRGTKRGRRRQGCPRASVLGSAHATARRGLYFAKMGCRPRTQPTPAVRVIDMLQRADIPAFSFLARLGSRVPPPTPGWWLLVSAYLDLPGSLVDFVSFAWRISKLSQHRCSLRADVDHTGSRAVFSFASFVPKNSDRLLGGTTWVGWTLISRESL